MRCSALSYPRPNSPSALTCRVSASLSRVIGIGHCLTGFPAAIHAQGDAGEFGHATLSQFALAAQTVSEGSHFDSGELAEVAIHGTPGRSLYDVVGILLYASGGIDSVLPGDAHIARIPVSEVDRQENRDTHNLL